jgi:hypothetical protein
MNFKIASRLAGALATIFLLADVASAASVGTGQFNIASSVYLTNTAFLIGRNASTDPTGANQLSTLNEPAQGAFADLNPFIASGTLVPTKSLMTPGNSPPGPVIPGQTFLLSQFIVLPDGIDVDMTQLPVSTAPLCTGSSTGPCQAEPGSPITLFQTPIGVSGVFDIMGRAYFAGSSTFTPLTGIFTAQFNAPPDNTIAGLLKDFNTHGFITTSFSATLSTTSSVVPEPGSIAMALVGASLFGLGLLRKRRLAR